MNLQDEFMRIHVAYCIKFGLPMSDAVKRLRDQMPNEELEERIRLLNEAGDNVQEIINARG